MEVNAAVSAAPPGLSPPGAGTVMRGGRQPQCPGGTVTRERLQRDRQASPSDGEAPWLTSYTRMGW